MPEDLKDLIEKRRHAALSLNDFSLLSEIDTVLRKRFENAHVNAAMDEIRDRVLGKRHPATIADLHSRIKNSSICAGHKLSMPKGNLINPRVVFLSQKLDRRTIEILAEGLGTCGFSREHVALTSIVRHEVSDDAEVDLAKMLPWFWEELKIWRPRIVVPLGSSCTTLLFGEGFHITSDRGVFYWLDDYCFLPTYSPVHAKTHPKKWTDFMEDLLKVKPLLE